MADTPTGGLKSSPESIISKVKKAIDLFFDKTYNEGDFYSHILQIIREENADGEVHRHQLERLLFKLDELQQVEQKVYCGHIQLKSTRNLQRKEIYKKKDALIANNGYSIKRFKNTTTQTKLL